MSNYETLAAINVNDKVEKKNKFSYLSWAWAVDTLMRADPTANWEYPPMTTFGDGTVMVYCTVTAFGTPRTMQLPVMNHQNKPIVSPNAFEINTAMQRCLVKAIGLHGLGLYLYAGEDLPPGTATDPEGEDWSNHNEGAPPDWQKWMADQSIPVIDALNQGNVELARDLYEEAMNQLPDEFKQKEFHFLFNSTYRSTLKKEGQRRRDAAKAPEQAAA